MMKGDMHLMYSVDNGKNIHVNYFCYLSTEYACMVIFFMNIVTMYLIIMKEEGGVTLLRM